MPFNGSGIYSAPSLPGSWNPAISGQQATPTDWNTLLVDLQNALSLTVTNDGQSTVTANIPFGGFRLTNVGSGTVPTDAPNLGQIQNGAGSYAADTGAADAYVIALAPAIAAYAVGQKFRFLVANTNLTIQPTLAVNGLTAGIITNADGSTIAPSALPANGIAEVTVAAVTTGTPTFQMGPANAAIATFGLRSYLTGLAASTAGSSGTMSVAVGCAANSTNIAMLILASAFTKTTSAWAVGTANGALDTGSIATTTVYHWYLIQRPDTGLVDLIFSLSASAPTLPTHYTLYRRIFSALTDGSSHWLPFTQNGDRFTIVSTATDYVAGGTSAMALRTLPAIPTGIVVDVLGTAYLGVAGGTTTMQFAPAALATAFSIITVSDNSVGYGVMIPTLPITSNTAGQINIAVTAFGTNAAFTVNGWIDRRGRDL